LLLSERVDGVSDYASAFPVYEAAAKKDGTELTSFRSRIVYSNGIAVRDETIINRPEVVAAFTSTIVKSLEFVATHCQRAISIFRQFSRNTTRPW